MQCPLPAIVKKPKGRVALLLNFRKNDTGADRVNSAGSHKHKVPRARGSPLHPFDGHVSWPPPCSSLAATADGLQFGCRFGVFRDKRIAVGRPGWVAPLDRALFRLGR